MDSKKRLNFSRFFHFQYETNRRSRQRQLIMTPPSVNCYLEEIDESTNFKLQKKRCAEKRIEIKNYIRDSNFSAKDSIVNIHATKGTFRVAYTKEKCFVSNDCPPTDLLSDFILKKRRT